jgi:hypothetical protein
MRRGTRHGLSRSRMGRAWNNTSIASDSIVIPELIHQSSKAKKLPASARPLATHREVFQRPSTGVIRDGAAGSGAG